MREKQPLGFFAAARKTSGALVSSLKGTISSLATALKRRDGHGLVILVSEGSPLETLIRGLLGLAFWVFVVAPVALVPAYYLLLTFIS